jgi:hypothetical protein
MCSSDQGGVVDCHGAELEKCPGAQTCINLDGGPMCLSLACCSALGVEDDSGACDAAACTTGDTSLCDRPSHVVATCDVDAGDVCLVYGFGMAHCGHP